MKRSVSFLALSFVGGIVAAGCVTVTAQAGEPGDRQGPRFGQQGDSERRERMLEEFDTDGDGKLSEDERATARESMRERRGKKKGKGEFGQRGPKGDRPGRGAGRSRDGGRRDGGRRGGPPKIDPDEVFSQFDEDNNDVLSREEFRNLADHVKKMRHEAMERFGHRGPPPGGPPEFGRGPGGPPPLGQRFGPPMDERGEEFGRRGRRGRHHDFGRDSRGSGRRGRPEFGEDRPKECPDCPAESESENESSEESDKDETSV